MALLYELEGIYAQLQAMELDDETFNNACLIFGIISDISLEDFSSNLNNSKYKKYKQEFKHIVDFLNDRNITKN